MLVLPPVILCVLLATAAMAGFAMLQWLHRRALLLRLNALLGVAQNSGASFGAVLERIGSQIPGASDETLKTALTRAGYFQSSALPSFVALRFASTAVIFAAALLRAPSVTALMLAIFLAFFASRLFVILLKLKAEHRERALRRELPPLVDILLMVLNSGVSIDRCLRHVAGMIGHMAPHTTIVLKRYVGDIDSGMSYESAFDRMGQRFAIGEGHDLANLIKQALLQGGEIMASLERFGAEVSDKRVAAAREQIGRKSVLLTLVMLAFFMPVLLITLGGPAVSQITETLKTVKHDIHNREARR